MMDRSGSMGYRVKESQDILWTKYCHSYLRASSSLWWWGVIIVRGKFWEPLIRPNANELLSKLTNFKVFAHNILYTPTSYMKSNLPPAIKMCLLIFSSLVKIINVHPSQGYAFLWIFSQPYINGLCVYEYVCMHSCKREDKSRNKNE
jgi:hypothetical protein